MAKLINTTELMRPSKLEDVVGMEFNKQIIRYDIAGSRELNQNMPSYLVAGPPGTGKSTIADCIALLSKRNNGKPAEIFKLLGSDIKTPQDVYNLAAETQDGDVIYVEEAHTLGGTKGKYCQAILLEWIENFKLLGGNNLDAPKTCFLFPTTNPGKLHHALTSRCKVLYTGYYSINEMKEILKRAGRKFGIDLTSDDNALTLLAQSSRGTPRTGVMHRLDILRKVMVIDKVPYNIDTVRKALEVNGVNYWGLERADLEYLKVLYHKMQENRNRAVSQRIMIQSTGFSDDMLDGIVESYLSRIDAINIVSQGRIITEFGCSLIGQSAIEINSVIEITDDTELLEMLQDDMLCMRGMRPFMEKLGLRYGPDNKDFQIRLERLGYITKQRAGIIKIIK